MKSSAKIVLALHIFLVLEPGFHVSGLLSSLTKTVASTVDDTVSTVASLVTGSSTSDSTDSTTTEDTSTDTESTATNTTSTDTEDSSTSTDTESTATNTTSTDTEETTNTIITTEAYQKALASALLANTTIVEPQIHVTNNTDTESFIVIFDDETEDTIEGSMGVNTTSASDVIEVFNGK